VGVNQPEAPMTPAESQPASAPPRHYALFVSESQARLFWKLRDEGVTLSAEGISWRTGGVERARAWNEIAGVNLAVGYVHKQGNVYACTISFRGGGVLIVRSVSAWGHQDEERDPVYREFVQTMHAVLARPELSGVHFHAGSTKGRALGLKIVMGIAVLFFVVLPLALIFIGPPLEVLFLVAAGAAFVWPLWRVMQANEPRTYSPRELPADLLP
jgi:hypothetical protein